LQAELAGMLARGKDLAGAEGEEIARQAAAAGQDPMVQPAGVEHTGDVPDAPVAGTAVATGSVATGSVAAEGSGAAGVAGLVAEVEALARVGWTAVRLGLRTRR